MPPGHALHDARAQRRAVDWPLDQGRIDENAAEKLTADYPEPNLPRYQHPWPRIPPATKARHFTALGLERRLIQHKALVGSARACRKPRGLGRTSNP